MSKFLSIKITGKHVRQSDGKRWRKKIYRNSLTRLYSIAFSFWDIQNWHDSTQTESWMLLLL
jgi:hypothetical protein